MKKKITLLLYSLAALVLASCADERLWDPEDIVGDGEANVQGSITFKNYAPALDGASRADGNAIDGVNSLIIYIYDKNGNYVTEKSYGVGNGEGQLKPSTPNNNQSPAGSEGVSQPVSTTKVDFSFPLEYGYYKIYAVANADMTGKDVSTESKLQEVAFQWQNDITKNNQMFGWFALQQPDQFNTSSFNADGRLQADVVKINKPNLALNAWLVRLASKVTVAYDASGLKENIFIFLKSVQIKDIPKECALGISNKPESTNELEADGEKIYYYDLTKYPETGPTESDFNPQTYAATLTKSVGSYGSDHSHEANALFFYENNQGTGKDKGQDVITNGTGEQKPDGNIDYPNGNDPSPDTGYKDEVRCGTYIEVKAFYRSNNEERMGQGEITYRFMLGKNTTTDYNATRNYHYKLTLKFNGFANDVDWHIEYVPEPDIYIPDPYYISYLYDKEMHMPVQIIGEIEPGTKLKAEIIENNWWPYNFDAEEPGPAPYTQYYAQGSLNWAETNHVWNGFLSLRNTGHKTNIGESVTSASGANAFNEKYWNDEQRGNREYEITPGEHSDEKDGSYTVTETEKDVTVFSVPFYTRAKNLVKTSGYTGNNPYVSYQRTALVRFTASLKQPDGTYKEMKKDVNVIQVRRVVNPKGIWRANDEDGDFDVKLVRLETEFTTNPWESTGEFKEFTSSGPWSAEIMVEGGYDSKDNKEIDATGWIKLSSVGESVLRTDGKIYGITGSKIEFKYKPSGTIPSNQVRYGIIKVRYHNYTCEHLIFVRQGYAPIPVASRTWQQSGVTSPTQKPRKWLTFNNRSQTELAKSPCEEGSLFRRFNWHQPINSINNRERAPFDTQLGNDGLLIYPETSGAGTAWDDIIVDANEGKYNFWGGCSPEAFPNVPDANKVRVAQVEDYLDLYKDDNVQYGFGILYDGQADGVQIPVKDAYSYYYDQPKGANGKGRGVRGVFVYNETNGAQIFFPLGAAGYGRRRDAMAGQLHYANRTTFMAANSTDVPYYRPLLWDLFRRPGANYWCYQMLSKQIIEDDSSTKTPLAWDFNYITFDVYPLNSGNIGVSDSSTPTTPTDALYIRCVVR